MSVEERDKYTGYVTTGHEWNGIKELNTKVPVVMYFFLASAFLFSVVYWFLMPAWPSVETFTKGTLNYDERDVVNARVAAANAEKSVWAEKMQSATFEEIRADDSLMAIVDESGPALFRDNCAVCHGINGEGGEYFPRLSDASWLWGGKPEDIQKTLQVGINADVTGTRVAQMPQFGGSAGVLDSQGVKDVALYVISLSGGTSGSGSRAESLLSINRGETLFQTNCSACHGAEGLGNTLLGAPNLADSWWTYGGDHAAIEKTLNNGRAGLMPAWSERLSPEEINILSLYVADLGDDTGDSDSAASADE